MKKFYITSAIPYVNAQPHIGHAQEFVYADCLRRYHTLLREDVLYLCGADENALKIFQAAEKAGKNPQEFTDMHNKEFLDVAKKLNVQFDVWQRGSDTQNHFPSSQKLWKLCEQNGDIYKKSYTGLYCVGCEQFYEIEELNEHGECFEHPGRKLDTVSEENYFFRLSRYQSFLENLLINNILAVTPDFRKNEALGFIKKGLQDFSISRSKKRARGWGIPVPDDPNQIMYVWFDALNIYQTGIGFGSDDEAYNKWSPQDVMVIGKGITRFHAIYWPAILKSAGLALPKALFIHGYLTVNGQKMSKTLGNVIDPLEIIDRYGTDALRYYLLKEIPSTADGDFSERRLKEVYNADLANGLGNVVARVAKLAEKADLTFKKYKLVERYSKEQKEAFENFDFNIVLNNIWVVHLQLIDRHINQHTPWAIKDLNTLQDILQKEINMIIELAYKLEPFLPETAQKILDQFTAEKIILQTALFPRI